MADKRLNVRSGKALATARRVADERGMTIKSVVEQALDLYVETRAYDEVEPGFYTELVARFGARSA